VWAFCVTAFEVFTSASLPYGRNLTNMEVAKQVIKGSLRLEFADSIPLSFRQQFERCQSHQPSDRPTFQQLVSFFDDNEGEEVTYVSLVEVREDLAGLREDQASESSDDAYGGLQPVPVSSSSEV
jgi:Protein tyrosine and serine/threonine kinase